MFDRKRLTYSLFALSLVAGLSGPAFAAPQHSHGSAGAPVVEMKLNNGQKWQTDQALRQGMSRIHAGLSASLPKIHKRQFTPAEFTALATQVQEQVDYIVANCKLPEEADLQLHVALVQVLEGIDAMKNPSGQEQGAVAIVQALEAYGEHFDHPGWEPVAH